MKLLKIIDRFLNDILILFFLILFLFSIYSLFDINMVYEEGKLEDDIISYKPKNLEIFDLEEIQKIINNDIIGWIIIDDTNIDYPILYSDKYIDRNYKNEYSSLGSIFLNNKNNRDFKDDYSIIYGHNSYSELMFSNIKKYKNKDYFDKHSTGKLYTKDMVYKIEIILYSVIDSNTDLSFNIDRYKNNYNDLIISNLKSKSININDIKIDKNDKLLLLSTCSNNNSSLREVLLCKLVETKKSHIITNFSSS